MTIRILLPLLLLPAAAPAQPTLDGETARVFRLVHAESPQQRQEITNAVRSIAEMERAVVDNRAGALAVRGTPERLDFAGWVVRELDKAPGAPPSTVVESRQAPGDYAPEARAIFLAHVTNPQTLQEILNTVRGVAEVQRAYVYDPTAAVVFRGTPEQVELATWIVRNLDKPAGPQAETKPLEYTYKDPSPRPATAVRIFRLAHTATPQAAQELVNAVRSISEVQRVMIDNSIATVTLRGTPAQVAMATWVIQELDRAAPSVP